MSEEAKNKAIKKLIQAFEEGKTIQSNHLGNWKDYVRQNQLDSPNFEYENIDNWRVKPALVDLSCMVCSKDFKGEPPIMCCSGIDCGCLGLPIEPIVCSKECYDNLPINKPNGCEKPCGENHCDTNGCSKRQRVLVPLNQIKSI